MFHNGYPNLVPTLYLGPCIVFKPFLFPLCGHAGRRLLDEGRRGGGGGRTGCPDLLSSSDVASRKGRSRQKSH